MLVSAGWPGRTDAAGFADKFNSMANYVVSSTLGEPLQWNNSHLLTGDLVDAYHLMVFPSFSGAASGCSATRRRRCRSAWPRPARLAPKA